MLFLRIGVNKLDIRMIRRAGASVPADIFRRGVSGYLIPLLVALHNPSSNALRTDDTRQCPRYGTLRNRDV